MADDDQIASLVLRPGESLAVELKTWIDPRTPEGVNKFVRAMFALRNRNGGFLLIGFDDTTSAPDPYSHSEPVEEVFHIDNIQPLIFKYSSQPFGVEVHFRERDGQTHPVIQIPAGVQVPVIVKSDLKLNGANLLAVRDHYFRTLRTNGKVSSAPIQPGDWPEQMSICFNNREADIGEFFRRQLAHSDVETLSSVLRSVLGVEMQKDEKEPTIKDKTFQMMEEAQDLFWQAIRERQDKELIELVSSRLTMQVSLVLEPQRPDEIPTHDFLNILASANPQYTGWPIWSDSRTFTDAAHRPVVNAGAWQALIVSLHGWSSHVDFMRLDPRGRFYLRRLMQDDMTDKVTPGTVLDVMLMVFRVAETLAVGVSFAKAAGWNDEDTAGFGFCWSALKGRQLSSWADPDLWMGTGNGRSVTSEIKSFVGVRVGTPHTALAPYVLQAVRPLFAVFDGFEASRDLVETSVKKLVERRM